MIASTPDGGGGGVNGGVLTVEIQPNRPVLEVLVHESWHALGECKQTIVRAAGMRAGTDSETFSEGLAYAINPGLWGSSPDNDPLARRVARDLADQKPFDDAYVRFNRLGLAMRPTVKQALADGTTFENVLAAEAAVFAGLREVDEAQLAGAGFYCFGEGCAELTTRVANEKKIDSWSRKLTGDMLKAFAPKIHARDTVVLMAEGPLPVEAALVCGDSVPKVSGAAGLEKPTSARAHVIVAWGPGGLMRVTAELGLSADAGTP